MDCRVLGPVEIVDGCRSVALGGPKPRLLLAVLLAHHDLVVPVDRLVDALWGDRPPPTALPTVQTHISRLRRVLGAGTATPELETRAPGYRLIVPGGALDATRAEDRIALPAPGSRAILAGPGTTPSPRSPSGGGPPSASSPGKPRSAPRPRVSTSSAWRPTSWPSTPAWPAASTTRSSAPSTRWSPSTRCGSGSGAGSCSRSTAAGARPRRCAAPRSSAPCSATSSGSIRPRR